MKKHTFLLVAMLLVIGLMAGAITDFYYPPQTTTGTYTAIVDGTFGVDGDDVLSSSLPIGFTFNYCGADYNSFKMDSNGFINIGGNLGFSYYSNDISTGTVNPVIAGFWGDLQCPAGSGTYKTEGSAPNRVLIAQWNNVDWAYGAGVLSFQIRLYETSNAIEIIMGANVLMETWARASIGMNCGMGGPQNFYSITPANPTRFSSSIPNDGINTFDFLTSGTTFSFEAVNPNLAPRAVLQPVPANNQVGTNRQTYLGWECGGGVTTNYLLWFGTNPTPMQLVSNQSETIWFPAATLEPNTRYYWYVDAINEHGTTSSPIWEFTTGATIDILMQNGSTTLDVGDIINFTDTGGIDGDYQQSEDYVYTFIPAPGKRIFADIQYLNTQSSTDFLYIYDGIGISGTLRVSLSGFTSYSLEAYEGPLTFHFVSQMESSGEGWRAVITNTDDETLPVTLSSFTAVPTQQSNVQLDWVTQSESGVLGYFVYRAATDNLTAASQVSPLILAANSSTENSYRFLDTEVSEGNWYYWLQSNEFAGESTFYGCINVNLVFETEELNPEIPEISRLNRAYPNPFSPSTTISYDLKTPENVNLSIYNLKGELVKVLVSETKQTGNHRIVWNGFDNSGRPVASGTYFIRMIAGDYNSTQKVMILK